MEIPIFPQPNVVLFPRTLLPIHIFEPRYREMVKETLERDKLLGMVLLKPTSKLVPHLPDVYSVGSLGFISDCNQLEEGQYDIILKGVSRFRILEFTSGAPYRKARVHLMEDTYAEGAGDELLAQSLISQWGQLILDRRAASPEMELLRKADFQTLVNSLCASLQLSSSEKQGLLELNSVRRRGETLIGLAKKLLADKELVMEFSHLRPDSPVLN